MGYPSGKRFYITITPTKKFSVNDQLISQQTILINTWYHIAIIINNRDDAKLYINNNLGKGTVSFPSFVNVAGKNRIGNDPLGRGILGKISKFQLNFHYLSKQDVDLLYREGP